MKRTVAFLFLACGGLMGADALNIRIGLPASGLSSSPSFTNFAAITTTNMIQGTVLQAPDTEAMTAFVFRYAATVGDPVLHKIFLSAVKATDGNPDLANILAAGSFDPPTGSTWASKICGAAACPSVAYDGTGSSISSYTITKGTWYFIGWRACADSTLPCAGATSPGAGNSAQLTPSLSNVGQDARGYASYSVSTTDGGTNWTKDGTQPIFGYRTASVTRGFPVQSVTANNIDVNAEQGLTFSIPSTWFSTFQLRGVRFTGQTPAAGKNVKAALITGTAGSLSTADSVLIDGDVVVANISGYRNDDLIFTAASPPTLNAGTTYHVAFAPQTSGTTNFALVTLDVSVAGDLTAFPGGTQFNYYTRASCGAACDTTQTAFTEVTTSRPMVELILQDIGASSGSCGQRVCSIQ